jgi:hypothetical protein
MRRRKAISLETDRYVDHSLAAHHCIYDASPDRRHPVQDVPGAFHKSASGVHSRRPVIRTLVLGERRAGYIIIFFGSVLGLVVLIVHMKGARGLIGGDIGNSGQAFLFVWTMLALGITSTFSIILSARALLSLPWRRSRPAPTAA